MKFVLLNPGWKALLYDFELHDDYKSKTRKIYENDRGLL